MKKVIMTALFMMTMSNSVYTANWSAKAVYNYCKNLLSKSAEQAPAAVEVSVVPAVVAENVSPVPVVGSCCLTKYIPSCPAVIKDATNSAKSWVCQHPKTSLVVAVVAVVLLVKACEVVEEEVLF